jgi:subfamily B ATP-binding cassette protein MsbA
MMSGSRPAIALLVVFGLVSSLSEGIGIGLLIPLLDGLLAGNTANEAAGPLASLSRAYADLFSEDLRTELLLTTVVLLIVVRAAIDFANLALSSSIGNKASHLMREALFRQLLYVEYGHLTRQSSGRLLNTVDSQTWLASEAISTFLGVIVSACSALVFVTLLMLVSWKMTVCLALLVLCASFVIRRISRKAQRLSEEATDVGKALCANIWETLQAMRTIRAYGDEPYALARFAALSKEVWRTCFRVEMIYGMIGPLMTVAYVPLFFGAFAFAQIFDVGPAALLTFIVLIYRCIPHIRNLDESRVYLAGRMVAVRDVVDHLDPEKMPVVRSGDRPFPGLSESIVYDRVSFRYDDTDNRGHALADISFQIRRWQIVAIVGSSGAGKSTIINLLFRFYDPSSGRILVDGRPLAELDLVSWRDRLALAGQDVELINGTIYDNIALGRRHDTDGARVREAARKANAAAFIEALPDAYQTHIGERGLKLSAGQRQRIGLARAFIRNPDVLVLDEATNALDSVSEDFIQETLALLAGEMTIVVIAHRLTTIRHADHILVVDGGRIVEQGTITSLLHADGMFRRLYGGEAAMLGMAAAAVR